MSGSPGPGAGDPDPIPAQDRALQWTGRFSPVVNTLVRPRLKSRGLAGHRIALVGRDGLLAEVLTEAGAQVAIIPENSPEEFPDVEPGLIIDRDATLTRTIRQNSPDTYRALVGVSDATATGTAWLQEADSTSGLPFPAVGAGGRQHTSAQATMQAILRLTNLRLAGKCVTLTAYDHLGSALAGLVSGMGGRVIVADDDPVAALAAHNDGHEVAGLLAGVGRADIVIVAGDKPGRVGKGEIGSLTDGTVIANATADDALDSSALAAAASEVEEVRAGVTRHRLAAGEVFLLAGGRNVSAASEPTIEVADLVAASHALACLRLASETLDPGLHNLPPDLQTAIATSKLASLAVPPRVNPPGWQP